MKRMNLNESHDTDESPSEFSKRNLLARLAQKISNSPYMQNELIVFKGGLFIGEYTGQPRFTQDVYATVMSVSTYEKIKIILEQFGEELIYDGIIESYDIKSDAVVGMSGGAKFMASTGRVVLSIDISLEGPVPLDYQLVETSIVGTVYITTLEQILCDKISVLFSRSRFRRAKDLYDTWMVLGSCKPDVHKLKQMLDARGLYPLPTEKAPFRDDCVREMQHAYEKFILRDAITEVPLEKPDFYEVVDRVGSFLMKFMRDDT